MAASVDPLPKVWPTRPWCASAIARCCNIPDVRRNPLVKVGPKIEPAALGHVRSAVLATGDAGSARSGQRAQDRVFSAPEEQADVQHLANQAAASLRLQERQAMREQLFHSEKLAATGQLISGVASELSAPIENIVNLAAALAAHPGVRPRARTCSSSRANRIAPRKSSPAWSPSRAKTTRRRASSTSMSMAAGCFAFASRNGRRPGLHAQDRLSSEPAPVLGSRNQIEQVLLNLLVHAERRAAQSPAKTLSIHSSVDRDGRCWSRSDIPRRRKRSPARIRFPLPAW